METYEQMGVLVASFYWSEAHAPDRAYARKRLWPSGQ